MDLPGLVSTSPARTSGRANTIADDRVYPRPSVEADEDGATVVRADLHWYGAHRCVVVPRAQPRRRLYVVGDCQRGMVHRCNKRHFYRREARPATIPDRAVAERLDIGTAQTNAGHGAFAVRCVRVVARSL